MKGALSVVSLHVASKTVDGTDGNNHTRECAPLIVFTKRAVSLLPWGLQFI